ncbi:MAG: glycosyltransferase family 39 protein [Alphaproteobacteria bacterium]|nr:glycosyltransferase family 39 protein [Alphaproteobacteria bacterium]
MMLLAIAGLALVPYAIGTRWGIGLRPDSTLYLGLWSDGRHQAPLYGWLIEAAYIFLPSPKVAAWLANAALLFANLAIFGRMLMKARLSVVGVAMGVLILLFLPQFLYVHVTVFSEPLFLLCIFATFLSVARYIERDSRQWLWIAAACAALTVLTRFSGVPLIGAMALVILAYDRGPLWQRRLPRSIEFGAIASAIFLVWLLLDRLDGGMGVGREAALLGNPDQQTFVKALDTFSLYLLPSIVPLWLRVLALFAGLGLLTSAAVWVLRPRESEAPQRGLSIGRTAAVFFLCYAPFLFLTLFVEANLTIHERYVLPLYVSALLIVASAWGNGWPAWRTVDLHPYFLAVAVVILGLNAVRGTVQTVNLFANGNAYASPIWYGSATIARVRDLPAGMKIYSNAPDAIRMLAERPADFWPQLFDSRTGKEDPARPFERQMREVRDEVKAGRAVIVQLDAVDWRFYLIDEQSLARELGLSPTFAENDGRIYGRFTGTGEDTDEH